MNEIYYIYCDGILGVKTNSTKFKWIYGSIAPEASSKEYDSCIVKFDICIMPEKKMTPIDVYDRRFQTYTWCEKTHTISYCRTLAPFIPIAYNIRIAENTVSVEIGENYFKFVKLRMMHLDGIYYLLSDLANVILLKNGLLTLYASAVHFEPTNKAVVCFAPPNTGKTLTATKLCEIPGYELVGEDVIITDGQRLYSCPWTCSYRRKSNGKNSAGSFGRRNKIPEGKVRKECDITNLIVLSLGIKKTSEEKNEIFHQVCMLNGYLFNYYSTAIVKILGLFEKEFCKSWEQDAGAILGRMVEEYSCRFVQSENPLDFYELIHMDIGENR